MARLTHFMESRLTRISYRYGSSQCLVDLGFLTLLHVNTRGDIASKLRPYLYTMFLVDVTCVASLTPGLVNVDFGIT
jgi:hypothetical protein